MVRSKMQENHSCPIIHLAKKDLALSVAATILVLLGWFTSAHLLQLLVLLKLDPV